MASKFPSCADSWGAQQMQYSYCIISQLLTSELAGSLLGWDLCPPLLKLSFLKSCPSSHSLQCCRFQGNIREGEIEKTSAYPQNKQIGKTCLRNLSLFLGFVFILPAFCCQSGEAWSWWEASHGKYVFPIVSLSNNSDSQETVFSHQKVTPAVRMFHRQTLICGAVMLILHFGLVLINYLIFE